MKNLKKVLSLVLALAMALSLMTAAFAADASDYKDYSKVTYKEAVDVMTAAGIFNGGDGNNFNPDATLNREQAAKIITYMLVGQETGRQADHHHCALRRCGGYPLERRLHCLLHQRGHHCRRRQRPFQPRRERDGPAVRQDAAGGSGL